MSFRPIIDLWPSRAELADDVGTTRLLAQQWWTRDFVPPEWWRLLVEAARRRGYRGVTYVRLAEIANKVRPPRGKAGGA